MKSLLVFLLFLTSLSPKPFEAGSEWNLPPFLDQNDKNQEVTPETLSVFFVSDMDASKLVHEVFQNETEETFQKRKIVFISDIHKMPSLISRFIAIPKMKKYTYPMSLIREKDLSNDIPREKGKVTFLQLQKKKIQKIEFLSSIEEIQKQLPPLK